MRVLENLLTGLIDVVQQELAAAREENSEIEKRLKNPLVRFIIKICGFFSKYYKQSA